VVVCLERDADLHTAQLMPLPLTASCFSKIQIGFTFLVPAHSGSSGKGPLNGCVRVCLSILTVRLLIDLVSLCVCACCCDVAHAVIVYFAASVGEFDSLLEKSFVWENCPLLT